MRDFINLVWTLDSDYIVVDEIIFTANTKIEIFLYLILNDTSSVKKKKLVEILCYYINMIYKI